MEEQAALDAKIRELIDLSPTTNGMTSQDVDAWVEWARDLPRDEQMKALISLSPVATHMRSDQVTNWIERVLHNEPDRAIWHVERLFGFGGSEIGPLVNSQHDESNNFTSAYEICAGKLCKLPPSQGDTHTVRGTVYEDIVQQFFEAKLDKMGFRWERLDDVQQNDIENKNNPKYFWMRSSLDGLYSIEIGGDWKTVIVDFKAPSPDIIADYKKMGDDMHEQIGHETIFDYEVPKTDTRIEKGYSKTPKFQDYIHQLHHYYEDARLKDVDVDMILLATQDYMDGYDPVKIFDIEIDERVVAAGVNAADFYWDSYILKGEVPPPEKREMVTVDDVPEEIQVSSENAIRYKNAADEFTKLFQDEADKVMHWTANQGELGGQTLDLGISEVRSKLVYDEDRLLDRFAEIGLSEEQVDALRQPGDYDTKKLKRLWHSFGENFVEFLDGVDTNDRNRVQTAMSELRDLKEKLPEKKKGNFDVEKLSQALLSFGEDPNVFITEQLSVVRTQKNRPEKVALQDEVIDQVRNEFAESLKVHEARQENQMSPS